MLEAHNKTVQILGIDAGGTMTDTFFVDSSGDPFPDISAARAMPVPNPEIQNCLTLREVRRKGDLR